jgi:hypothetical protein
MQNIYRMKSAISEESVGFQKESGNDAVTANRNLVRHHLTFR